MPRPGAASRRPCGRQCRVGQQAPDGVGHRAHIGRTVDHQPGLPVDDRFVGAAGGPATWAHRRRRPRGRRCRNLHARARANGLGTTWRRRLPPPPARQLVVGERTEEADRGVVLGDATGQSVVVPSATGDGHGELGQIGPRPQPSGVDEHVHPFRGTRRLTLTTSGPSGEPEVATELRPVADAERRNRSRSTPGGMQRRAARHATEARSLSPAG